MMGLSSLPVFFLPSSLTPTSSVLLAHYLGNTCAAMASRPPRSTILITHVVPQLFADELLMHVILALSGTHINFRHEATWDIRNATSLHYGMALRSLRQDLQSKGHAHTGGVDLMRFALILILLSFLEVTPLPHTLLAKALSS
jgi:hypothetical protein